MPWTVRDPLLALDIQDPDDLAKKADALFQSHQSSSVHFLSDDPIALVYAIRPPKPRPAVTVTHLHLSPTPPDVPALQLPLTATRGLCLPSPTHAGSTVITETKPRSASNPAPGRETNWMAGRTFFLPARTSSYFLYLKDSLSNRNFLVDSWASVSVVPAPASSP